MLRQAKMVAGLLPQKDITARAIEKRRSQYFWRGEGPVLLSKSDFSIGASWYKRGKMEWR